MGSPANSAFARILAAFEAGRKMKQAPSEDELLRLSIEQALAGLTATQQKTEQEKEKFPLEMETERQRTISEQIRQLSASEEGGPVDLGGTTRMRVPGLRRRAELETEMAGPKAKAEALGQGEAGLELSQRLFTQKLDQIKQELSAVGFSEGSPEYYKAAAKKLGFPDLVEVDHPILGKITISAEEAVKSADRQFQSRQRKEAVLGAASIRASGGGRGKLSPSQENTIASYNSIESQLTEVQKAFSSNPKLLRFVGPLLADEGGFGGLREKYEARFGKLTPEEAQTLQSLRLQLVEARREFFGTAQSAGELESFKETFPVASSMTSTQFLASLQAVLNNVRSKRDALLKQAQFESDRFNRLENQQFDENFPEE